MSNYNNQNGGQRQYKKYDSVWYSKIPSNQPFIFFIDKAPREPFQSKTSGKLFGKLHVQIAENGSKKWIDIMLGLDGQTPDKVFYEHMCKNFQPGVWQLVKGQNGYMDETQTRAIKDQQGTPVQQQAPAQQAVQQQTPQTDMVDTVAMANEVFGQEGGLPTGDAPVESPEDAQQAEQMIAQIKSVTNLDDLHKMADQMLNFKTDANTMVNVYGSFAFKFIDLYQPAADQISVEEIPF